VDVYVTTGSVVGLLLIILGCFPAGTRMSLKKWRMPEASDIGSVLLVFTAANSVTAAVKLARFIAMDRIKLEAKVHPQHFEAIRGEDWVVLSGGVLAALIAGALATREGYHRLRTRP
jgi:hypothetical protein